MEGSLVKALLEPLRVIGLWFSSRPNRLRLRGARVEVMVFLISRGSRPRILLGKSCYHDIWMPPQEGVKLGESFDDALRRCMQVECGISPQTLETLYFRSIRFIGEVDLPLLRQGERPVADDAVGTPLENVELRRKAYWMATVIAPSDAAVDANPDGTELTELGWFTFPRALDAIRKTNHPEKAELLVQAIYLCERDVMGGARPRTPSDAKATT